MCIWVSTFSTTGKNKREPSESAKHNFYKRWLHELRHRDPPVKIAPDPIPFNPALFWSHTLRSAERFRLRKRSSSNHNLLNRKNSTFCVRNKLETQRNNSPRNTRTVSKRHLCIFATDSDCLWKLITAFVQYKQCLQWKIKEVERNNKTKGWQNTAKHTLTNSFIAQDVQDSAHLNTCCRRSKIFSSHKTNYSCQFSDQYNGNLRYATYIDFCNLN